MLYRRFGRTELQMPVVSCGGMRYQHQWKDVDPQDIPGEGQKNLEATIERSLALGINHIETARGYGSSEMQLGWILPRLPREKMIVQTKVAPMEDTDKFVSTFETSMRYLKLDYVDLLGLHGINNEQVLHWAVRPGGCLEAARKLQEKGLCRHVGFSTHGSCDTIIRAICTDDYGGFDYVNLHWYYIYQRNWPAVEAAAKRDMGVFIISPSDKGGKLYEPSPKLVNLTKPLHPIIFNDLFCLSRPQVHTLSIGAARPTDFDLHVQAVNMFDQAATLLPPILGKLRDAMRKATGFVHPEDGIWSLPEHDDAPANMNLPILMWLLNLARGWDMVEYGRMRYNLLGNGGHWFPGQNASHLTVDNEPAVMAAAALSPYARDIVQRLQDVHSLLGGDAVKRLSSTD
ncbi:MAG: aldo/keto reductase [Phycisphaeraceae bacterium]|nr:aldo/keto reductase [Phycisphaeraceae bacterium]